MDWWVYLSAQIWENRLETFNRGGFEFSGDGLRDAVSFSLERLWTFNANQSPLSQYHSHSI